MSIRPTTNVTGPHLRPFVPLSLRPFVPFALLFLLGCPPAREEPPAPPPPPDTPRAAVTPRYRYPAQAPVADSLAVHDLVERDRGSVVLLYFWTRLSTDGRAELPRIAELQEQYRDAGLRVLACNLDDPRDWDAYTRPLLMSARANFPCVIVPEPSRGPLANWIDAKWNYELPARFLFDRQGRRVVSILANSPTPYADVEMAVRDLLGGDAASQPSDTWSNVARIEVKLIDVNAGKAIRSFPPLDCTNPEAIDEIADQIAKRIGRPTDRVAVLPFAPRRQPSATPRAAASAADRLLRDLRLAGLSNVSDPAASRFKLDQLKLTAADIDLDPAVLKGRWQVDYIVLGWCVPAK